MRLFRRPSLRSLRSALSVCTSLRAFGVRSAPRPRCAPRSALLVCAPLRALGVRLAARCHRCVLLLRSFARCVLSLLCPGWGSFVVAFLPGGPRASARHYLQLPFPVRACARDSTLYRVRPCPPLASLHSRL